MHLHFEARFLIIRAIPRADELLVPVAFVRTRKSRLCQQHLNSRKFSRLWNKPKWRKSRKRAKKTKKGLYWHNLPKRCRKSSFWRDEIKNDV